MKSKNWKYVLGLSLTAFVAMGILVAKTVTQSGSHFDNESIIVGSVQSSYIARDINLYTESVPVIVIGSVAKVGEPYLRDDRGLTSQQNIQIRVEEVLKGDLSISNLSILIEGGQTVLVKDEQKGVVSGDDSAFFTIGENVLLFLGTNSYGDYVVFAGPNGKYLIDEQNTVTSIGDFEMPLKELRAKINAALQNSTNS
ncbi:MAG: hypothetical protein WC924_01840 [Candidatus Gracilibacteria bacterium]